MGTRLYPQSMVARIVTQTGLSEEAVLQIIEQQRADVQAVVDWVTAEAGLQGCTPAEVIGNAWLPGTAPANAADVIAVAVAVRLVVAVEVAG